MPILSRSVDKKSIETVFSIVISRPTGDKWQSKTLFLSIFDLRLLIVDNVFDSRLSGVSSHLAYLTLLVHCVCVPYKQCRSGSVGFKRI